MVVPVVAFVLVTTGVMTGYVTTGVITVGVDDKFVAKFGFVVKVVVFEETIVVPAPVLTPGNPVLVFVMVCLYMGVR